MYDRFSSYQLILSLKGAIEHKSFMDKDYHKQIQQRAIELLIDNYGIESVIVRLAEYCQTQAKIAPDNISEHWQDIAEALSQIPEGWDVE